MPRFTSFGISYEHQIVDNFMNYLLIYVIYFCYYRINTYLCSAIKQQNLKHKVMTNLDLALQKCNLTVQDWDKLCWYNYNHLLELRGKVKQGQRVVFNYNGMPVAGLIHFKNDATKQYLMKFTSPFMNEELTCWATDYEVKIINN